MSKHRIDYIGPRFGLTRSTVLISGVVHHSISLIQLIAYKVEPPIRLQRWETTWSIKDLTLWLCVEMSHCAFSTAFILGNVLENCLACYLPPNTWLSTTSRLSRNFLSRTTQPRNVDTIWILLKSVFNFTSKATNAPVVFLVLYGFVGVPLASGDP